MKAISRWLSEATPLDQSRQTSANPEGIPDSFIVFVCFTDFLGKQSAIPLGSMSVFNITSGGVAIAQPPATG